MTKNLKTTIEYASPSTVELDQWIRAGRQADVAKVLTELDVRRIAGEQLADWSNLARRAGLLTLSLRLLQPVVRIKESLRESATPKEKACYAASLAAIGALAEARQVLARTETVAIPEVQLFSGFINVYSWDYQKAAPFFQRYLELEEPTEFQKAVASTNLSAANCFLERYDDVHARTERLIETTRKHEWFNLQSEAWLISAQASLGEGNWQKAEKALGQARLLAKERKLNLLHVEKWELLLDYHRLGSSEALEKRLENLTSAAREQSYWEIVRDCHYHVAILTKDRRRLEKVYFGTPFTAYRERLLKKTESWFKPPKSYRWDLEAVAEKGSERASVLDLAGAQAAEAKRTDHSVFLRVLRSLASDFYRPLKIGCLFNEIYPDEYYDSDSSPVRVKTALSRTRATLKELELPMAIRCLKQDYYLSPLKPIAIRVRTAYPLTDRSQELPADFLKDLKSEWPHKAFSSQQAAAALEISPLKAQKLLKLAAEKNRVYQSGVGRARVYRFRK